MTEFGLPHVIAALLGYLLGSIPFGLLLTKLAGLGDIRSIGSGNIGATNVLRTGRKDLALATLLLDGGKGAVAVLIARLVSEDLTVIAGGAAILGHQFPVWLKFKGGKGVATKLGTLIAVQLDGRHRRLPGVAHRGGAVPLFLALGLDRAAASPFLALWLGTVPQAWLAAFAAVLVWIRHHENIRRLLKGEEPKIGKKKAAAPPASSRAARSKAHDRNRSVLARCDRSRSRPRPQCGIHDLLVRRQSGTERARAGGNAGRPQPRHGILAMELRSNAAHSGRRRDCNRLDRPAARRAGDAPSRCRALSRGR